MSQKFSSVAGVTLLKWLGKLPFPLLYLLSDIIFLLLNVFGLYRRKVVLENLKNAFPDKKDNDIKKIAERFFRHFSDLVVEITKMAMMKAPAFRNRMLVTNKELLEYYFSEGRSVVVLTMHYNNWEWGTYIASQLSHNVLAVYKPLYDKTFDSYMNATRARFGAEMVPNAQLLRRLFKAQEIKEPVLVWLAGDQTPPFFHKFWIRFLNQETMFYPGPAAISKRFNFPVIFQHTLKKSRGHYETTFELLVENPAEWSEKEIMKAYIRRMEEVIQEKPEYYLWSHKRWKNRRPIETPMVQ